MMNAPSRFERFRRRVQAKLFAGMPDHMQRLGWSAERIAGHQRVELRTLLAHAIEHSPFHARRLAGVEPARFELADLTRLPIMTKAEMMAELDEVLTDRRLTRRSIEEAIARTADEPIPLFEEYVSQVSGGSSGRRGVFVLDVDAMVAFSSSILRPTIAGSGGLPPGGMKIAIVAAAAAVHATGIAPRLMEGSSVRFFPAPAVLPLAVLVERLNAIQPDALYGYPSMLARLAVERQAGRLRIAPSSLRATSETLLPEHRAAITSAFGTPLVDTFGSSEGLVGVSDPDEPALTFASDLSIVELVDELDRPAPPGEPSAKVLVTNLYNRVQPLIRYVLEDSFVRQPDDRNHGHLRATVRGRSDEIFHYGGTDIHPLVVRAVLVKTPEVTDYQVRQTARGMHLALVTEGELDRARLCERLRAALRAAGLEDPTVTAQTVPHLERQPGTGKLRRFIPACPGESFRCVPAASRNGS
jgi:phenylacetate-coenzyme A ligase PaaK-like adenylate-forming protein